MESVVDLDHGRRARSMHIQVVHSRSRRSIVEIVSLLCFISHCVAIFLLAQRYVGPPAENLAPQHGLRRRPVYHRRSLLGSHESCESTAVGREPSSAISRLESAIETLEWKGSKLQRSSNASDRDAASRSQKRRALAVAGPRIWPKLKLSQGRVMAAIPLGILAAAICSAGGLGGGGLFVPMFNLLLEFDSKTAAALSTFTIMGGAFAAVLVNMFLEHPSQKGKPLVDYKVALLQLPTMLLGVSIGVILNVLLPGWIVTSCLVFVLVFLIHCSMSGGIRRWNKETLQMLKKKKNNNNNNNKNAGNPEEAPGDTDHSETQLPLPIGRPAYLMPCIHGLRATAYENRGSAMAEATPNRPKAVASGVHSTDRGATGGPCAGALAGPRDVEMERALQSSEPLPVNSSSHVQAQWRLPTADCTRFSPIGDKDKDHAAPTDFLVGLTDRRVEHDWEPAVILTSRGAKVHAVAETEGACAFGQSLTVAAALVSPDEEAERKEDLTPFESNCSESPTVSSCACARKDCKPAATGSSSVPDSRFKNCQLVIIFLSIWCTFVAIQLLRGSKAGQGVHLKPCGVLYWLLTSTQVPLALIAIFCTYRHLRIPFTNHAAAAAKTLQARENDVDDEFVVGPEVARKLPVMALLAGVMGGMLGIGGAMLLNPMMLGLGMNPQVTAATCAFMLFFSSSMSVIQFWLMGTVPLQFALIAGCVCFGSSVLGVLVVARLIRKLNRSSIVVFVVSFVMIVSVVVISTVGGMSEWYKFKHGEYMGFHPLCR